MLKRIKVKKLGRSKNARTALLRALSRNLFEKGVIETSEPRAKELRRFVDHLLKSSGKDVILQQKKIRSVMAVDRVFAAKIGMFASSLEQGKSATRIFKIGQRLGDASPRVKIELLVKMTTVAKETTVVEKKTTKEKKAVKAQAL